MPHERNSVIASFVEHPVYINFKIYCSATFYPKWMCKSNFFEILAASRRKQWYWFVRGVPCIEHFVNVWCSESSFLFQYATINPTRICRRYFFLKFLVLREKSSVIASFVEHPVYSIFKMHGLLILVFLFWFTTIHLKYFCKSNLILEMLGAPRKEQCYWFFRGALYI